MAVYSRYSRVLEADGSRMSVKTALALINATFDEIETEQDSDVDADTRFCLDWFKSYGWATRPYGDAESLAVPLGLSVEGVARGGIITSGGGKVALIKPLDLDPRWDPTRDDRTSVWEATCHIARAYATEGREAAARLMAGLTGEATGASSGSKVSLDDVQRLALRLYELMETKDAATAGLFNGLGGAWADVAATAQSLPKVSVQDGFNFTEGDD
jgi:putative DNA methylase